MWSDVSTELSTENLVPVPNDKKKIQAIFDKNHKNASQVQLYQKQLLREELEVIIRYQISNF